MTNNSITAHRASHGHLATWTTEELKKNYEDLNSSRRPNRADIKTARTALENELHLRQHNR